MAAVLPADDVVHVEIELSLATGPDAAPSRCSMNLRARSRMSRLERPTGSAAPRRATGQAAEGTLARRASAVRRRVAIETSTSRATVGTWSRI